jgi:hypothetical protein
MRLPACVQPIQARQQQICPDQANTQKYILLVDLACVHVRATFVALLLTTDRGNLAWTEQAYLSGGFQPQGLLRRPISYVLVCM